ncbi:Na+/H+ antiporter NhaA [Saccharopolyspora sp. CA-218241]|uniref:Na+/H+ antiporter NhaA n=1 Tax=Saccharopolyspora sp. CA-218241 TaxID=3240027 RepID=UPI003D960260
MPCPLPPQARFLARSPPFWANSPWREAYSSLAAWKIGPAALHRGLTLAQWTADGLLALIFVAGLELRRGFVAGDLRGPCRAALPVAAAIGGVAVTSSVFYFPSITSSVAISVIFLFLFSGSGAVNAPLESVGVQGPNWFTDSRGKLFRRHIWRLGGGDPDAGARPEQLASAALMLANRARTTDSSAAASAAMRRTCSGTALPRAATCSQG